MAAEPCRSGKQCYYLGWWLAAPGMVSRAVWLQPGHPVLQRAGLAAGMDLAQPCSNQPAH